MRIASRFLLIALLGFGLAACNKQAGGGSGDGAVLATVNGTPITQGMLDSFVREQAQGQLPQLTPVQKASLVKTMVNMELLAQQARKDGVDKQPEVAAEMQLSSNSILAQNLMEAYLKKHQPSDADLKAAYDAKVKAMDPHQYKARHILVKDKAQADDIIAQLNKGGNFAALAKKFSMDPGSAQNGGELGDWFSGSTMVPEFATALSKLKKGEYTKEPVQTQYGWHVIQLEDVRDQAPPGMEQMREQLANDMQRKTVDDYLKQLRDSAKITTAEAASSAPASVSAAAPQH
ncbi:MAG TPA: peptidylprolyl isomerase [Gammaproteobacteria bacterium]|jgi:peptidyl-prolyl cis-trans isomerase C